MKRIIFLIVSSVSLNSFASGSSVGVGFENMKVPSEVSSLGGSTSGVGFPDLKIQQQLYYMGRNQADVSFATNSDGSPDVKIHSMKIEEISEDFLQALEKSKNSLKWERVQP